MGQPAVPRYVTERHKCADCPPGHRFSLYFDGWNERWEIAEGEKASGLRRLLKLADAGELLVHLRERQDALAESFDDGRCLIVEAKSTSPFATGLGNEHPIENGFAFLTPYGLPYLAGSGVKGTLRRAAEDLGIAQDHIDALFGPEDRAATSGVSPLSDAQRRRGALAFWDCFPEPKDRTLVVEIMTPHYSDYYQGKSSPHDAGQPNPIPFLAVPAGSLFLFVVTFEPRYVPPSAVSLDWKQIVRSAFAHAFDWLGFGAKTAVGYGALAFDKAADEARAARSRELAEKQRVAAMTEQGRQVEALRVRLENHAGSKQPISGVLYFELNKAIKAAREAPWPQADRTALAELAAGLGFAKIDFQSREKEIKREIQKLREET